MDIQIYTMTHKKFTPPPDSLYIPLHVGHKNTKDLGYTGDDTGDNISQMNCYYSELTGVYWLWKNVKCDIIGVCHYRRYLLDSNGYPFTADKIQRLLSEYDLITTKVLELNNSYYYGYAKNHHQKDLDATEDVVRELYPDYYEDYRRIIHDRHTLFGNMLICRKMLFDDYCNWLFHILFEVQNRIHVEDYDAYHKRVFGFISEILLYIYAVHNGLSMKHCMVGMSGEKAEVIEVKNAIAEFFRKEDYMGAKNYFLKAFEKRPDLLMEASDIFNELKMSMQVISTCEYEAAAEKTVLLHKCHDFGELMALIGGLNRAVSHKRQGMLTMKDQQLLNSPLVSKEMCMVAEYLAEAKEHSKPVS